MLILVDLLQKMVDSDASDLHVTASAPPQFRIHGALKSMKGDSLTPEETKRLCFSILTKEQRERFEKEQELDMSFGFNKAARFRVNLFMQRGVVAGAFRRIPYVVPNITELGLPQIVAELAKKPNGLLLVTGPTGSGKSTTMASMIDQINRENEVHILTVEDPIEYVHENKRSLINQREVGTDTHSFNAALRHVLRQDPDVVLIGEMRDLETIETALILAETGHLCMATLHTNSAVQTVNRIVDVFPANQQTRIRTILSFILIGVISQHLLPDKKGTGRVLATEVLVPNLGIRNLIREDKLHQIYGNMQMGQSKSGSITLNQSLIHLVKSDLITPQMALQKGQEIDELRNMLRQAGYSISEVDYAKNRS